MEPIILNDYNVVKDVNGYVVLEDNMVLVKHIRTGVVVKLMYEEVASFYNLKTVPAINEERYEEEPCRAEPQLDELQTNEVFQYDVLDDSSVLLEYRDSEDSTAIENIESTARNARKWTDGQTRMLLELYAENMKNVGPLKRFRNLKSMWGFIGEKIKMKFSVTFTPLQVETRYRCVLKRTKKAIDICGTSGAVLTESGFEDEIRDILEQDDSIMPDSGLSPGIYTKKKGSNFVTTMNKAKKAKISDQPHTTSFQNSSRAAQSTSSKFRIPPPTPTPTVSSPPPSTFRIPPPTPSPTIPTSSVECSTSLDSENFNEDEIPPTPKKRVKKSTQQLFCEQLLILKKEKNDMVKKLLLEEQSQKQQRHQEKQQKQREKEEQKQKRHQEKMKLIEKLLTQHKN